MQAGSLFFCKISFSELIKFPHLAILGQKGCINMNDQQYQAYIKKISPNSPIGRDLCFAFVIGGLICTLGQVILNGFQALGLDETDAGTLTSVSLVFLSALLTGLSLYDDIAKFAGAGTLVPITGFANSIAAPAIEFKTDGRGIIRPSQKYPDFKCEYDDSVQMIL